jgi:predicted RNase H-like HicB family nuclease
MELTVETRAEGAGYWSQVQELPGCFASARTLSELREALGEAVGLYLWDVPAQLAGADLSVGTTHVEVEEPAD